MCDFLKIPGEWKLQKHQKFIKKFVNPETTNLTTLFLFHNVGSGKTCSAVLASEQYSTYLNHNKIDGKIYIIGNMASHNEFRKTINSECGKIAINIRYDETAFRKNKMENYIFLSFQKFGHSSIINTINNFNNSLIIIDEAHSLLNENKFYQNFTKIINNSKNYKIILLSATPIINESENLINFINIMQSGKKKIKKSDFFIKGRLKKDWKKNIIKFFKNRVSYVQTYNIEDFPIIKNIGKKLKIYKYTKVIQCFMNKTQNEIYNKNYKGKITSQIRNIMNFVYYDNNIIEYNNIEKYKNKITQKNLINFSPKFWRCIQEIIKNNSGNGLIFSRFVYNSGIIMFGEIMKLFGFMDYNEKYIKKSTRRYIDNKFNEGEPAKFYILHGKIEIKERNKIINIFNSEENKNGKILKYILGSNLIKESIDLKRVQHVHILDYQDNFSRLNQIIGRAVRYKSFEGVKNIVNIYKYVISIKNKYTAEELEYKINEEKFTEIKKIERMIKIASIDCVPQINGIDGTEICDFKSCKLNCLFENYDFGDGIEYDIFYGHYDLFDIYNCIIKIFYKTLIISIDEIFNILNVFKKSYIITVLSEMINKKIEILNKGYLICDGFNVYLHPKSYDYLDNKFSISINMRNRENPNLYITDITNDIIRMMEKKIKKKKIIKHLINENTFSKINKIINLKEKVQILEDVLYKYNKNNKSKLIYDFLKYFKNYLIDKNVVSDGLIYNKNYNNKIENRFFIGHSLEYIPKILVKNEFKYKNNLLYKKVKENDFIVGYFRNKKLKYSEKFFKDKRKIRKGFICNQSSNKKELLLIYNKLLNVLGKNNNKSDKININLICVKIFDLLRELQYKNAEIRWLYEF
jgi:hypothetical protein